MIISTESLCETLVNISRKAGEAILEIYKDESQFDIVDFKADDSPLTLADKAAHNVIAAALQENWPEIPILSEEGKSIAYEERKEWTKFWLVDPLDGTKEFIKRNGEFTVNIALIENGAPIAGCVHVPVQNKTYYASKGEGAFLVEGEDAPKKIQADTYADNDKGLRMVVSRSHMSPEVAEYVAQFDEPEKVSMGSSLKFMLIAEGNADIYPRLAPTMEWDTGAAQIIVEEAGGTVMQHNVDTPLEYNKENLLNPFFIAFAQKKG